MRCPSETTTIAAAAARPDGPMARSARPWRVGLLIIAAALMSLTDLWCTLEYMRSIGMAELNPLARKMVELGGARQLVLFKLLTMAMTFGSLFLIRHDRRGEWCAWVCAGVMLGLTLHWVDYNRKVPEFTKDFSIIALSEDRHTFRQWVTLMD